MARPELMRLIDGKALNTIWWGHGQMLAAIQHAGRITGLRILSKCE
jgi:hypothetical protein